MMTGEIKNRIGSIWDTFWTGGIANSVKKPTFKEVEKAKVECENRDAGKKRTTQSRDHRHHRRVQREVHVGNDNFY